MRQLRIGDTVPLERGRGPQSGERDPVWFAFLTVPQREASAKAWLEIRDIDAWFPTREAVRTIPRGPRRKVAYQARVVPGYVFGRFTGLPQWDVLKDSPYLAGVVAMGDTPAAITDEDMSLMSQVPERLAEMHRIAVEAKRVRAGRPARVLRGVYEGWTLDVSAVDGGVAWLKMTLLGKDAVKVDLDDLEGIPDIAPKPCE